MYSQSMPLLPNTRRRQQNAVVRIIRMKPASYWQVWFIYAPVMASAPIIGASAASLIRGGFPGKALLSLPMSGTFFLVSGAVQCYRLDRRRDAVTPSEGRSSSA
jgi:hypothetical protein